MKQNIIKSEEAWEEQQKILIILAHPDDPEFFLGATISRWTMMGHSVTYVLLTRGDKGGSKEDKPEIIISNREKEQRSAGHVLGVESVEFMDNPDGYLVPDLKLRREVVRVIRKIRPDIVVTGDPTNYFPRKGMINHPDHRYAGQVVSDAVFPAAGNYLYFPELLLEGLEPVNVKELWLSNPAMPNFTLDVTAFWENKIKALHKHISQIGDLEKFDKKMRSRHTASSTDDNPKYEELFNRIVFSL
jgi:LmbE family N-acetylglucosaminyl deacetylase